MVIKLPGAPPRPEEVTKNPKLLTQLDERIFLDQSTNSWIFEDEDSIEYEYNFTNVKWEIRHNEESESKSESKKHKLEENSEDEEEKNKRDLKLLKKQKLQELKDEISKLKQEVKSSGTKSETSTNAVFVSNLPNDISNKELDEIFSKYGILSQDYNTGENRIKMYYDENNTFKGEATIFYHSKESVPLAVEMLDNTPIRPHSKLIKVEPATFTETTNSSKKENAKSKIRTRTSKDQQKLNRAKEALNKKLSVWDDEDTTSTTKDISIGSKVVVVEDMFRVDEYQQDPLLGSDIKEDIKEECVKLGIAHDISKIIIYDISAVVMIKFKSYTSSQKCIDSFDGRYFDGLKLRASPFSGQKFERTNDHDDEVTDEDRLNHFGEVIDKVT
ncbi:uncharacterized protein RJT21DRAFT_81882 [Scheffersomyces amazonensis]|uniref:uncharacterized protein n=1 Tax=Scheffersomyces amazonensis TaxID=1078765 RepID=UPI00315D8ADB